MCHGVSVTRFLFLPCSDHSLRSDSNVSQMAAPPPLTLSEAVAVRHLQLSELSGQECDVQIEPASDPEGALSGMCVILSICNIIIQLRSVCRCSFAVYSPQLLLDRLGRYLKLFVLISPISHAFASQFVLAHFYRRKSPKRAHKNDVKLITSDLNSNNCGLKARLKCYWRPTASLQLNNKHNTKYNITVT